MGVGSCVLVPLASRQAVGYVIGFEETSPVEKTRPIIAELDSPVRLTDEMLDLAEWISARYLCPLPRVVCRDAAGGDALPGAGQSRECRSRIASQKHELATPLEAQSSLRQSAELLPTMSAPTDRRRGERCDEPGGTERRCSALLRQLEKKGAVRRSVAADCRRAASRGCCRA